MCVVTGIVEKARQLLPLKMGGCGLVQNSEPLSLSFLIEVLSRRLHAIIEANCVLEGGEMRHVGSRILFSGKAVRKSAEGRRKKKSRGGRSREKRGEGRRVYGGRPLPNQPYAIEKQPQASRYSSPQATHATRIHYHVHSSRFFQRIMW